MSARAALVLTLVVLLGALAVSIALATPWRALPAGSPNVAAAPARDFGSQALQREDSYHRDVRPPAYAVLAVNLVLALLLGLSPWGPRIVTAVAAPLGGGWVWRVLLGTVAITGIARLATLPLSAWVEVVQRRYELSTRSWGGWVADVAKSYGVGLVLTVVALLGIFALVRRSPQWWWTVGAAAGALLVVVVSFAYPLVVEPVFNKFTSLPEGRLRTSLLQMADRDGVPARDVLVADASRRTSSLNAYVSGFGSTRRIVVYDTLLERASDDEVRLVVAHELGHAKRNDVLGGTALGALGVASVVCALGLVLQWSGLLRRIGVESAADPRALVIVLMVVAVLGALSTPVQSLVSRRVEARADVHSLDLTREPAVFVRMQQRLATSNLSDLDPNPVVFGVFATHPTAPQRIALARSWARANGVPPP